MYKLTFNSGDDFYAFGNLNIGSKKVKQNEWFAVEPQNISFNLMYYPTPNTEQEVLSNNIIDSIFVTGTSIRGIVRNSVFRLYYNNVLLFTGIIDKTQCEYNKATKDAKIFCYDILKLLSFVSEDEKTIIDDAIIWSSFISGEDSLQEILNDYNIIPDITVTSSGEASEMILQRSVRIITDNVMKYKSPGETSRQTFMEYNENDKCIYIGWFHFNRGFINYGTENAEVVAVQAESGLYRLDGLSYYKVYVRTDNYIPVPDGVVHTFSWANTVQLNTGNIHRGLLREYMTYIDPETGLNIGLPETDELIYDGLTYTYELPQESNSAAYNIKIEGDFYSYTHAIGDFLTNGYNEANETKIIDVFKMFLILNNFVCYAQDKEIKINSYSLYSATYNIPDNDIISVKESYITENEIEDIPAISGNSEKLLTAINDYYKDNISQNMIIARIPFNGYETVKVGDRITNTTYGIDIFIIELKINPDNHYTEIKGIAI